MFGKKARVVGQTVLFACVVKTWRNSFRKRGGFPIQGLNYDAATLPVVRKTAPARATSLSAWQMASESFSCLLRRWLRSWHWRAMPDSGLPAPDSRQIRGSFRCESCFFLSGSIKMSSDLFGNLGDGAKHFSRLLHVVDQAQNVFRQQRQVIGDCFPIGVGLRGDRTADILNAADRFKDFTGKFLLRVLGFSHCEWLLVFVRLFARGVAQGLCEKRGRL